MLTLDGARTLFMTSLLLQVLPQLAPANLNKVLGKRNRKIVQVGFIRLLTEASFDTPEAIAAWCVVLRLAYCVSRFCAVAFAYNGSTLCVMLLATRVALISALVAMIESAEDHSIAEDEEGDADQVCVAAGMSFYSRLAA